MKNKKFVLIDDENAHNLICRINLQKVIYDAEVLSFSYPPDALNYLRKSKTEQGVETIVLVDLSMPIMDGFEVLDEMSTFLVPDKKSNTEVFVCSSTINQDEVYQSMAHSLVKGFIEKPLTSDKIMELFVNKHITSSFHHLNHA